MGLGQRGQGNLDKWGRGSITCCPQPHPLAPHLVVQKALTCSPPPPPPPHLTPPHLVTQFVSKAHNLVLNGWAVARSLAVYPATVDGGLLQQGEGH